MRLAALLLAAALAAAAGPVQAAAGAPRADAPLQALLDDAERSRSNDPVRFAALLADIEARLAEATAAQKLQLRYLKIYEMGYAGRFEQATAEAVALFDAVDDPSLKLRAGALLVNSYGVMRLFPEGLRYLDLTLALVDRVHDPELRAHAWFAASTIYSQIGQYGLARHYAERILDTSREPRTRCFAGMQHLDSQYQLSLSDAPEAPAAPSDAAIGEVIDQCAAQGEQLVVGFSRGLLARTWARAGKRAEAIALLRSALPDAERTRYPRMVGDLHSLLAELLLADGDLAGAERHAREAVARGESMAFSLPLVSAHRTLYEVAERRGDTATALAQYRAFAEADKAYLDAVKTRELAFQLVKHETAQKNQTIDLLNNQNRVLQLEQKVAQQSARNIQLLVALLVVLLASIGTWAYRTKRTQVTFRRLAETDALTGVSNRHHFTRRSIAALDTARRAGDDVALVMFDLDRFKEINDGYGHAVGDWVLVQVARACSGACRRHDLFGRLGGEEFAFLLVGADAEAATGIAQACRQRLRAIDTADTGRDFTVSASFGVATSKAIGYDFHTLLARADEAMYRAKRDGRDRVATVEPHDPTPA